MICPKCNSENVSIQMINEEKKIGCLMCLVYIILALTLIGIPIVILLILLRGKKTTAKSYCICQECGYSFSPNTPNKKVYNNYKIPMIVAIILMFVAIILNIIINIDITDSINFEDYEYLDVQILNNDYINNEISAKDKHKEKYYYFSGDVYEITSYLNDNYITLRYNSNNKDIKIIDIGAYFDNKEDLLNVNKGDNITIYCQFNDRTIDDYVGISHYSFKNCRFKK